MSPRGGPRPGAGAPKGNLNGYKNGKYSEQMLEFALALLSNPDTRRFLLALSPGRGPPPPVPTRHKELEQEVIDLLRIKYGRDAVDSRLDPGRLQREQLSEGTIKKAPPRIR